MVSPFKLSINVSAVKITPCTTENDGAYFIILEAMVRGLRSPMQDSELMRWKGTRLKVVQWIRYIWYEALDILRCYGTSTAEERAADDDDVDDDSAWGRLADRSTSFHDMPKDIQPRMLALVWIPSQELSPPAHMISTKH